MEEFRKLSLERRKSESAAVMEKYPNQIPVICDKLPRSVLPKMDKIKFLMPRDTNIHQVVYIIRKRIQLSPEQGIFVFINGMLPTSSSTIESLYKEHKDEDGFLYIYYTGESTFGF